LVELLFAAGCPRRAGPVEVLSVGGRLRRGLAWLCVVRTGVGWRTALERRGYRAHRRRDADAVGVVAEAALDAVSRRQKGVEALDEIGMSGEELGDAVDDSGGVDTYIPLETENRDKTIDE
jgi:hypothetical protein